VGIAKAKSIFASDFEFSGEGLKGVKVDWDIMFVNILITFSKKTCFRNKKLRYRRGTARRSIWVSSCCVHDVWKLNSNSISYLQGHSRAVVMVMVTFDRPHMTSPLVFHCNYVSILHRFRDIITLFHKIYRPPITSPCHSASTLTNFSARITGGRGISLPPPRCSCGPM